MANVPEKSNPREAAVGAGASAARTIHLDILTWSYVVVILKEWYVISDATGWAVMVG